MKIFYSVYNCGDGSAYPKFFVEKALADFHQDHLSEGWGESCTGSITVEGDNLSCPEAVTRNEYFAELLVDDSYSAKRQLKEFIEQFFPNGTPDVTVTCHDERNYGVVIDGKVEATIFSYENGKTVEPYPEKAKQHQDDLNKVLIDIKAEVE